MIVEFIDEAEQEFTEAVLWYESKAHGLGKKFRNEVMKFVNLIAEKPYLWKERNGGYRRVNCSIFPYFIAYLIEEQHIVILAVGHVKRNPEYWKSRSTLL